MPERNADRVALLFQLGPADPQVVPGVRQHADLFPHALAIHSGEIDVKIGEGRPGAVVLVVAELPADDADLAVLFLGLLDEITYVDEELAIKVRATGAIPAEQIV